MPSLFAKIVRGEIPAEIVYRDQQVTAFRDISPAAPVHVLIVPNRVIASVDGLEAGDEALAGHLLLVAQRIAREQGVAESGYRLIVNTNRDAGQEVGHLHVHLLGGRPLGPLLAGAAAQEL